MSSPTPTKEKTKWPLVGEEKELFVDFALGHRDTQIRSRIMFSQKVEIFRSCYNFEERKTMGLHICKEHLSKEADFPVSLSPIHPSYPRCSFPGHIPDTDEQRGRS